MSHLLPSMRAARRYLRLSTKTGWRSSCSCVRTSCVAESQLELTVLPGQLDDRRHQSEHEDNVCRGSDSDAGAQHIFARTALCSLGVTGRAVDQALTLKRQKLYIILKLRLFTESPCEIEAWSDEQLTS